jgi:hypothetical protein
LWAPLALFLCGLILLALASANMMQARQMMRRISLPSHR